MRVLEYGKANPKTMLFLPCTAEPEWAFTASVTLLAQDYHVLQIVYDGHGETGEDFISVEHTVEEIIGWLHDHGIFSLDAAYGCSLGGACLTRFLAAGEVTVEQAIFDGGITPYQMPALLFRLACLRDFLGFKLLAGSRKLLEAAYPPEKYTLPGHDPVKEYDAMEQYLKSYSSRTIRNIFCLQIISACPRSLRRPPAVWSTGTAKRRKTPGARTSALSNSIFLRFARSAFPAWSTQSLCSSTHRSFTAG